MWLKIIQTNVLSNLLFLVKVTCIPMSMFDDVYENTYQKTARKFADSLVSKKYQAKDSIVDKAKVDRKLETIQKFYDIQVGYPPHIAHWLGYIDGQVEFLIRCSLFDRMYLENKHDPKPTTETSIKRSLQYFNECQVIYRLLYFYHPKDSLEGCARSMYGRILNAFQQLYVGSEMLAEIRPKVEKIFDALAKISIELHDYIGPRSPYYIQNMTFLFTQNHNLPSTDIFHTLNRIRNETQCELKTSQNIGEELKLDDQKACDLQNYSREVFSTEIVPELLGLYHICYLYVFILIKDNNDIFPSNPNYDLIRVMANLEILEIFSNIIAEIPTIISSQNMGGIAGLKNAISKQMADARTLEILETTYKEMIGRYSPSKILKELYQITKSDMETTLSYFYSASSAEPSNDGLAYAVSRLKSNLILSTFEFDDVEQSI